MNNGHSSVVQVFVQATLFNWLEPYKSPDQQQVFGTAFFIDEKGHLITSFHVISGASSIQLQIPTLGKERFEAETVGVCPERDIALIKLEQEAYDNVVGKLGGIKYLPLGDSDAVKRTQEIMTLGYPLGQDALKSTQGIVSGRQNILGESFIQITAALNPGNSGGPSVDDQGRVVGINAAIIPDAQSVGYIIPISDVKAVIEDLYKVKLYRRPLLGCDLNYGTVDMLTYLNNPDPGGLYVSRVYDNMLFHKAGIQEGDMIYKVQGLQLDMYGDTVVEWSESKIPLAALVNRFRVGEQIDLEVYRKGAKKEISFAFDLLDPLPIRTLFEEFEDVDYEIIGGMVVMNLTLNHVNRFGDLAPFLINFRKRDMQFEPRLIVSMIFPNSQVSNTRTIYPGDLIAEVNDTPVKTLEEFRAAVKKDPKFLRVRMTSRKFAVMSMDKILRDEESLSKEHVYQQTPLVKALRGDSSN